jgi:uncharacterized protein YggE
VSFFGYVWGVYVAKKPHDSIKVNRFIVMKHRILFSGIFLFTALVAFGQVSGNQLFNREYDKNLPIPSTDKIHLTDSTFFIRASVLQNVIADSYVATFGVAESAKTLNEANTKIDDRIQKFITTQTRMLDYKIVGDYAEQFLSGFEQKKNVIVKFTDIKTLDAMLKAAAEQSIYDLVKVDYIVDEPNAVYEQLFQTAMELLNRKKEMYAKATGIKLKKSAKISSESFYYITPSELYQSYTPKNISTDYDNYHSSRKKTLQTSTTHYYDHVAYFTFDKVINPVITEPAVEYILNLQLKFDIEK